MKINDRSHSKHRRTLATAVAMSPFLFGACMTSKLHENHKYAEKVSSILISSDDSRLVVMTPDYHYIFSADPAVVSLLRSPIHRYARARFGTLHVSSSGVAQVSLNLMLNGRDFSDDEEKWASQMAYRQNAKNEWIRSVTLKGARYEAQGIAPGDSIKLNHGYTVNVEAEELPVAKAGKSILTPITVAADGALTVGAIPLIAVASLFISASCLGRSDCAR